ncbi:hypothetical protein [Acidianus bottle-shaped virus 2 strain ABV2]|uniref:Uncharacterized protein n=1 Tax=Acidianus bottle-shaped virus 2 strain ABV2 TaxID=1732173 RepID=A0A0N9NXW6_9VIRU|nr:hypothetical protein AVU01_gp38 [Acidianus bottle-shaped virus 2 strain ABV2]ALG96786.1 hypothetical protein [Acidianus bottle-shaped virus 2 strain ABV2]
MNWKSILVYLLIFSAGVIIGKIKFDVKLNRGSCPTSTIQKYQRLLNQSESSDYL